MNRLVRCFAGLLVLALALTAQAALAEEEDMPSGQFYFTPGQDLVILDRPEETITLKGKQPSRTYAEGYDLQFVIENHENRPICVGISASVNNNIELQNMQGLSFDPVEVPANSAQDYTIHVMPSRFVGYNDRSISASELAEISKFSGIHKLDFFHDSWYANEGYLISVSYWAQIHFN